MGDISKRPGNLMWSRDEGEDYAQPHQAMDFLTMDYS